MNIKATEQEIKRLQVEVERLQTNWQMTRSANEQITQQLADQRAIIDGLVAALKSLIGTTEMFVNFNEVPLLDFDKARSALAQANAALAAAKEKP